jgi:ribosome biogenesis protein MAK21
MRVIIKKFRICWAPLILPLKQMVTMINDDLDQVANEDDEDLVGNVSDAETDAPQILPTADGEDFDNAATADPSDEDEDTDTGDADDGINDEVEMSEQRKRK